MLKADPLIGKRAYGEIQRIFGSVPKACKALGLEQRCIYRYYKEGVAPSMYVMQKLYSFGADLVFIISGDRMLDPNPVNTLKVEIEIMKSEAEELIGRINAKIAEMCEIAKEEV